MEDGDEKDYPHWNDFKSYEECYLTWSKSSVDNKTIFKHLDKLSEGKLQAHSEFEIIDDIKATRKIFKKK